MTTSDVISGLAVCVSVIAIFVSWRTSVSQAAVSQKVSSTDRLLTQRQMFVTLWPHISQLDAVDPNAPIEVAVIKAANALELIAVCWEADVVDRDLIRRSFADSFIKMYGDIESVNKVPGRGISGRVLLSKAQATVAMYNDLTKERNERDKPQRLPTGG